ncbi:1,2-phenylacetyl-CoA epoxidase subunit PaaD [Streptomyces sp. NPDC058274]|uniref:1,2-phenylacetyl-CoA epoxidase subunit PaaD n=1 Tax=Streptomyces sp. NPDC058274 TaxID=3346416 RepID=UPI0036E15448
MVTRAPTADATTATPLEEELRRLAGSVPDPELPVLTLDELGVLRAVHIQDGGAVDVELTPTYTGCPAIEAMSADIERLLHEHGICEVTVHTVLSPAWSTDDISDEGRRKLREFGIAPPRGGRTTGPVTVGLGPTRTHTAGPEAVASTREAATTPDAAAFAEWAATPDAAAFAELAATPDAAASPETEPIRCPHCDAADTELLSRFSSTACKALRRCLSCREPFDHFKEL